jgi:hypothetical protein
MKTLALLSLLFWADPIKDVSDAVEKLRHLMVNPDEKALIEIAHPRLSYGHSNARMEDRAAFVDALVTRKSHFKKIDYKDQSIEIVGNTAVVRHILEADTFDGGVANSIRLHILTVWVKENKGWKLMARQAVKLP